MKRRFFNTLLTLSPLMGFLLIWHLLVSTSDHRRFLFSSPGLTVLSLVENIWNGILVMDFFVTGSEALLGFLLGNFVGATVGLSLWYSESLARIARPYVVAIGAVPIIALAPMMIMWFGTNLFGKVMLAAISTVIVAIVQAYEGAKAVSADQIRLFQSFGASRTQIFLKLVVPSSLVWVLSSLKLNIGFALLGAIIAEFISSSGYGLGHRIFKAGGTYDVGLVLASVICIVLLALLFAEMISLLEKIVIKRWNGV